MSSAPHKYSPEIIRQYREMVRTNAFHRKIVESVPIDLTTDRVTLDCGHQEEVNYHLHAAEVATKTDPHDGRTRLAEIDANAQKRKPTALQTNEERNIKTNDLREHRREAEARWMEGEFGIQY
jgi:hypothetical protein